MAALIIYKSTDGNAPILSGTIGSLVNVLNKCLVTGYGEKSPAGWTMPFSNIGETKACFRNNQATGTGFYLLVDHSIYTDRVSMTAFESMTDENTGFFPYGSTGNVYVSNSANATARPWVVVATDAYVYFFSYYNLTSIPNKSTVISSQGAAGLDFFFGDFDSAFVDDFYNSAFTWTYYPAPSNSSFGTAAKQSLASSSGHYVARSVTGVAGGLPVCTYISAPGSTDNYGFGQYGSPYSAQTGYIFSKIIINNGAGYTLRGWLPDVFAPCNVFPFENMESFTDDTYSYLSIMFRNYNIPNQLLFRLG